MLKKIVLGIVLAGVLFACIDGLVAQNAPSRGRSRSDGRIAQDFAAYPDAKPMGKDKQEKKILAVLDDLFENERRGNMNAPPEDGRVFRLLAETTNAQKIVEIGTSNGYSGIWWALALRKTGGRLITHEIDAGRANLARKNFKRAGVEDIITLVEGDAHENILKIKGPVDIVFLDADKSGYYDYLQKILPLVRPGGLIVAHNTTNAGPDMADYLEAVTTDPDLETIFLHKEDRGISVTLKKR